MNDSTLKNQADLSLEKAKEVILQHIPKEEILSIYVKGSYVQNELQPESDVDVVVILKDEKYLPEIYELTNKFGKDIVPNFQIVAYTLKELQTGEKASNRIKNTTPVSLFVKHMSQLPLLYGSKPDGQLFTRTDKKDLTSHISVFNNRFFPDFYNGKFKFNELVKQVLWLTEREQRTLGNTPEYSWQKLTESIEDKNHIVHDALKLRRQKDISKTEQDVFLNKLKDYISLLEEKYK